MVKVVEENKRFKYIKQSKLNEAKLFSDRFDTLSIIPNNGLYLELGAGGGDYARWLLDNKSFERADLMDFYNQPCTRYGRWNAENHEQYVIDLFKDKNITTIKGDIKDTINNLTDKYNYIYIDADHDYESIYFYLNKCAKLLNNNGVIGINDYTLWGWFDHEIYECIEAVNQFLMWRADWHVIGYSLGYCGYSDIYIQKRSFGA